ncbi:hypothetical protein ACFX5E_16155 [Flavobacterium sp. LS2P90]|uniref:Uncharacterized protein n=1 Tax=Flavobacterium xylosi TaxID=3230415 RepID=A0ABW6HZZ0_9FLAO
MNQKPVFELDSQIQPYLDNLNKIIPIIEELIPIEKKLNDLGITLQINFHHTLNLSTKEDIAL